MTKFRKILLSMLSMYVSSIFLVAGYFNWQYATQHGFASWIAFGEVVATSKAVVWPYFAVKSLERTVPEEYRKSSRHYWNAKAACDKAMMIVIDKGDVNKLEV